MRTALLALTLPLSALAAPNVTTVCVDVQIKSWTVKKISEAPAEEPAYDPYAIDPAAYLERNVRYEITHEVGFEAVDSGCAERVTIELYPLRQGWTIFARYSGHAREEKVNEVQLDEFVSLSERLSKALLRDMPISDTISRQNVLRADSEANLRTIHGTGHLVLALGTLGRVATLPQASSPSAKVEEKRLLLTPISAEIGYRGKYEAWGLEWFLRGQMGSNRLAPRRNPLGGHADFDAGGGMGLHFLRYLNAHGMTSLYFGGGAQFEASRFSIIKPEGERRDADRESLYTGGLAVDLVMGYEFMRASSVHFFVQAEGHAPLYLLDTSVDAGAVDTYLPGGLLQIGMIF
ncbi:hypothetical protein KKF91_07350 [Myxococcota bacterium]|nr:hypothetical protein [Myxococcota bacterium]MBU1430368.1 hypothetical protein [Myxococcota bacterium]MBU1898362.1 hypothetical protein [Myxococcota bacterium]